MFINKTSWSQGLELTKCKAWKTVADYAAVHSFEKSVNFLNFKFVVFSKSFLQHFWETFSFENRNILQLVILKATDLTRPPLKDHKRLHLDDPKPQL